MSEVKTPTQWIAAILFKRVLYVQIWSLESSLGFRFVIYSFLFYADLPRVLQNWRIYLISIWIVILQPLLHFTGEANIVGRIVRVRLAL